MWCEKTSLPGCTKGSSLCLCLSAWQHPSVSCELWPLEAPQISGYCCVPIVNFKSCPPSFVLCCLCHYLSLGASLFRTGSVVASSLITSYTRSKFLRIWVWRRMYFCLVLLCSHFTCGLIPVNFGVCHAFYLTNGLAQRSCLFWWEALCACSSGQRFPARFNEGWNFNIMPTSIDQYL